MEKEKETATLKLRRSAKAISCWSLHTVCKVPQPASCARQLPKAVRAVWSFHFKCTRTKCVGTVCVCRADNWKSLFNIKFQRPASRSRNHHYFWLKTHTATCLASSFNVNDIKNFTVLLFQIAVNLFVSFMLFAFLQSNCYSKWRLAAVVKLAAIFKLSLLISRFSIFFAFLFINWQLKI